MKPKRNPIFILINCKSNESLNTIYTYYLQVLYDSFDSTLKTIR